MIDVVACRLNWEKLVGLDRIRGSWSYSNGDDHCSGYCIGSNQTSQAQYYCLFHVWRFYRNPTRNIYRLPKLL